MSARAPGTANGSSPCPGPTAEEPEPAQLAFGLAAAEPNAAGDADNSPATTTSEVARTLLCVFTMTYPLSFA